MTGNSIFLCGFLSSLILSFLLTSPVIVQSNEDNQEYVDETAKILAVFNVWTETSTECNSFLRVSPISRYVDLQGDMAVVFGSLQFRRMLNDQLTETPVRFSFTLTREKTDWKILHMQSVTIPFSSEAQAVKTPNPE